MSTLATSSTVDSRPTPGDGPYGSDAALVIVSRLHPAAEIAGAVGLEPYERWEVGDLRGGPRNRSGGRHTFNGVSFRSALPGEDPPELHVERLLERLLPAVDGIARIAAVLRDEPGGPQPRLWVWHTTREETVGLSFGPSVHAALAGMAASLDLVVSVYPEEG